MEFHEKLRELRQSKGLTQEELAGALFVSRTAVSKWESGRGYPNIDSLKEIAKYFSVTTDDLLSGERLISVTEKETPSNLWRMRGLSLGITDLCSFALIVLPLYPKPLDGYIASVNLFAYTEATALNRLLHWILFLALIASGVANLLLTRLNIRKAAGFAAGFSIGLGVLTALFLALTREAYAVTAAFLALIAKGTLLFKYGKADCHSP